MAKRKPRKGKKRARKRKVLDYGTNDRLRELRTDFNLRRSELAALSGSTIDAVDRWLLPEGAPRRRRLPERTLRLIELELGIEAPAWTHRAVTEPIAGRVMAEPIRDGIRLTVIEEKEAC